MEESFFTSWSFLLLMLGALICVAVVGVALIVGIILIASRRDRRSPGDGDYRP